jgi:ribonuclease E
MLIKGATHNLIVRTRTEVALYVLNHKRAHLRALEERFQLSISVNADASVNGAQPYIIDRGEQVHTPEAAKALVVQPDSIVPEIDTEDEEQPVEEAAAAVVSDADADVTQTEQQSPRQDAEPSGRRRRRRRRRKRPGESQENAQMGGQFAVGNGADNEDGDEAADEDDDLAETAEMAAPPQSTESAIATDEAEVGAVAEARPSHGRGNGQSGTHRRHRGSRGSRGRSREPSGTERTTAQDAAEAGDAGGVSSELRPPAEQFEVPPTPVDAESPLPRAAEAEPDSSAVTVPEPERPVRRRSTVREPAPVGGGQTAPFIPVEQVEPPTPAALDDQANGSTSADETRPRRTGWWSRRA